ncbi:site-specific integrase [Mucilaginibacter endophyticus]|uniref:site-specific integrase n=1 Tax=Mucilaginibacter endophyticus TaxID=2675003 RepID=UPI000E0D51FF|nr:site-specific integrase [Mucilaginibacter endophyticus]
MKPTDFSKSLTDFLSKYLPGERGMSTNTIQSYKTTFILFITFMESEIGIPVTKLNLKEITQEQVVKFLNWLQTKRKCSNSSRNVRLAAFHSFTRYLQYSMPESLYEWQRILAIRMKRSHKKSINYLTVDGIRLLLEQPNQATMGGRRDLAMLALMYDCAARVQEIIDLTPVMVRLNNPPTIKLIGKGNKARIVPLLNKQTVHIERYMREHDLLNDHANLYPLFSNYRKEKLTRAGVAHILKKYLDAARLESPKLIPETVSCHSLRHSKAMHLLQNGTNLVYIRDILGHASVQTTEVYARADSMQKREAIEKAYVGLVKDESASWMANDDLLSWLKNL